MKDFSKKNYQFYHLPAGQKLVYSSFLVFILFGWISIFTFYALKSGFDYQNLVDYYRGNEQRFMYPKSFLELWEITHFHLFTMPVVFLILVHLFMLTAAPNTWKAGLLFAGFAGMILDIGSPWLIVYWHPHAAVLKMAGRVLLNGSFLFLTVWPLKEMWSPRSKHHKRQRRGSFKVWLRKQRIKKIRNRQNKLLMIIMGLSLLTAFVPWAQAGEKLHRNPEEPAWNVRHDVYMTLEEALEEIFPGVDEIKTEIVQPEKKARKSMAQAVGHPILEDEFTVYKGYKDGRITGYAVVGEEVGKFRPITSITRINPDGRVGKVRVMVYRESHGDDVKRSRFLHQYKGKETDDPIRINRDIISISGATISVRSMNAQVRKVLHLIHEVYLRPQNTSDVSA